MASSGLAITLVVVLCNYGGRPVATAVRSSSLMMDVKGGRNMGTRCDPPVVGLELHAELVVEDRQVAVSTAYDCLRHNRLHLLRHYADIRFDIAVIGEAIEADAVVEAPEKHNIVLEPHIGAPSAAATSPTASPETSATHASAAATSSSHPWASPTKTRSTALRLEISCPAGADVPEGTVTASSGAGFREARPCAPPGAGGGPIRPAGLFPAARTLGARGGSASRFGLLTAARTLGAG